MKTILTLCLPRCGGTPMKSGAACRMSEEIPLHRLADLCTLLVKTFYQDHPTNAVTPTAVIDAGTFENQSEKIELRRMNGVPEGFAKENERIKERLRKLRNEQNAANLD
jgi:hypothetical protein